MFHVWCCFKCVLKFKSLQSNLLYRNRTTSNNIIVYTENKFEFIRTGLLDLDDLAVTAVEPHASVSALAAKT